MKNRIVLLMLTMLFIIGANSSEPTSPFTTQEKAYLRVRTAGLFRESKSFTIELDSLAKECFSPPLLGAKIISGYATKQRPNHTGIDLKTKANDSIRAVFDGVVRLSKPYYAYGNLIVVRHANGLESIYSHNAKNLVKSGDVVKAGEVIGLVGRTGRASTDHLHIEFRLDGQHINPAWILDLKADTLRSGKLVCTQKANGVVIKKETTK